MTDTCIKNGPTDEFWVDNQGNSPVLGLEKVTMMKNLDSYMYYKFTYICTCILDRQSGDYNTPVLHLNFRHINAFF